MLASSRVLVLVVALATLLALLPSVSNATTNVAPSASPRVVGRTASTVTTDNGDGTQSTEIHSASINYQDDAGQWQRRDDSLVRDPGGGFHRAAGPAFVQFAATADAEAIRVSDDGWSLGFTMLGAARGRPVTPWGQNRVRYAGVGDGVDLEYRVVGDRVKEEVVLRRAPVIPASGPSGLGRYRFGLSVSGVTPRTTADGTIAFVTASGSTVASVPPGMAYDSMGRPSHANGFRPATKPVTNTLVNLGANRWAIDVAVDPAWLLDVGRVYPVYIDPTIDLGRASAASDAHTYIQWGDPAFGGGSRYGDHNYDGEWVTSIARGSGLEMVDDCPDHNVTWQSTTYSNVDVSPVVGRQINTATWHGKVVSGSGSFEMRPVATSWQANTLTHDTAPSLRSETKAVTVTGPGWVQTDVTDWVRNWAEDGGWAQHGVALSPVDEVMDIDLAAAESGDGPYMSVTYDSAPGPVSLTVTKGNRTVTARWTAPAHSEVSFYTATLYHASSNTQMSSQQCNSCLEAIFTGLTNQVGYYVKVTATNPHGFSTVQSATVTPGLVILGAAVTVGEVRGLNNAAAIRLKCAQPTGGDPVNVATGHFSHTFADLFVPGRGVPLAMSHTYSSDAAAIAADGPLGHGWTFTYGMSLGFADPSPDNHPWPNTATVRQENGSEAVFELDTATSAYKPNAPRVDATVVRNANGSYTFTRRSAEIFGFDSTGRLTELKDPNGYVTAVTRPSATTTVVTDPAGRTFTLAYSGGHLQSVTEASTTPARTVTFRYLDGQNNLNEVVDATGGTTSFTYDAAHRLLTMRIPSIR